MPDWKIIQTRKADFGMFPRRVVDVLISDSHIDGSVLVAWAEDIVKQVSEDVDAIAIFFWQPGQEIGKEFAKAAVDWAPGGDWDKVAEADSLDKEFQLVFNET